MGEIPESKMVQAWWNGKNVAPTTAVPEIKQEGTSIKLMSSTIGASIGYKFRGTDAWLVYTSPIKMQGQDSLYVVSQRIGYNKSEIVKKKLSSH